MTWAVGVAAVVYKPFRAQPVDIYRKINGFVMGGDGQDGSGDHAQLGRQGFVCGRMQHSPSNARVLNMLAEIH